MIVFYNFFNIITARSLKRKKNIYILLLDSNSVLISFSNGDNIINFIKINKITKKIKNICVVQKLSQLDDGASIG